MHSHTWYANLGGHLAKLVHGIPHVATVHSLEPLRPWKAEQLGGGYALSSFCERTGLEAADAIIAVSARDARRHPRALPGDRPATRVTVIHNGIDTRRVPARPGTGRARARSGSTRTARSSSSSAASRARRGSPTCSTPPASSTRRRSSCSARARRTRPSSRRRSRAKVERAPRRRRTASSGSRRCSRGRELIQLLSHATRVRLPVGLRAARDREPGGDGLRDRRSSRRGRAASRRSSRTASPGCSSRSSASDDRSGEPADPPRFAHELAERVNALLADPARAPGARPGGTRACGRAVRLGCDRRARRGALPSASWTTAPVDAREDGLHVFACVIVTRQVGRCRGTSARSSARSASPAPDVAFSLRCAPRR